MAQTASAPGARPSEQDQDIPAVPLRVSSAQSQRDRAAGEQGSPAPNESADEPRVQGSRSSRRSESRELPQPPQRSPLAERSSSGQHEQAARSEEAARPEPQSGRREGRDRRSAEGEQRRPRLTVDPSAPVPAALAVDPVQQLSMLLGGAPVATGSAPRRRRESGTERQSRRGNQQATGPQNAIAALATQTETTHGNVLPSLYGYYTNEPAPTSTRQGAAQGVAGNTGRPVQTRSWRAPATTEMSTVSVGGGSVRSLAHIHPAVAERILNSGPSVANLQPVANAGAVLSPGSESSAAAARLQNSRRQHLSSTVFPAGGLTDESGAVMSHSSGARPSRKFEENNMTFFSWIINDVQLLHDEILHGEKAPSGGKQSEVWDCKPLFGNEQWCVELQRRLVPMPEDESISAQLRRRNGRREPSERGSLTISLSNLLVSSLPFDAELPTQVMLGVRTPQVIQGLPRPLDGGYVWREFVSFVYSRHHDTLVCEGMPPLDELLGEGDIAELNAMELVVQVGMGPAVFPMGNSHDSLAYGANARLPFETINAVHVPRTLVDSLTALVDDIGTGDLMITVREKGILQQPSAELAESVGMKTFVQPWPTGTPLPAVAAEQADKGVPVFVRDRVLWAHAAVLRARSEFFATMLDSSFSEGMHMEPPMSAGAFGRSKDSARRPYRVLHIPDADYVTMYWFLRYLYTEEVQLLKEEDIQAISLDDRYLLDRDGAPPGRPDWKWHRVEDLDEDDGLASVDASTGSPHADVKGSRKQSLLIGARSNPVLSDMDHMHNIELSGMHTGSPGPQRTQSSGGASSGMSPDPHPHPPMLPVPPASALSLYRLAHRYNIQQLCELTMAHIVSQLTPHNATNYLLCTSLFDQIQRAIQNYIYQNWAAVSSSEEFERCCEEVSAGEWGLPAGRALVSLMRNLRTSVANSPR